jgi:putative endonuclease
MAKHIRTGNNGEHIAQQYLQQHGYTLLGTNLRFGRGELDIVCTHQNILIFVEVKTRQTALHGTPEDNVTPAKEQLLIRTASMYLQSTGYEGEIRFDIISVTLQPTLQVLHFQDAFFPTWE